jgi:hypothetical protein
MDRWKPIRFCKYAGAVGGRGRAESVRVALRDPEDGPAGWQTAVLTNCDADAVIEIKVTDERGKVNINATDEQSLIQLFLANGLMPDAEMLSAAILIGPMQTTWCVRAVRKGRLRVSRLPGGPANRGFIMVKSCR